MFTRDYSTMFGSEHVCMVLYSIFLISYCLLQPCYASYNYLTPNQTLIDGQTLVSAGESFTLGFFSPHNSQLRYLGIWYSKIPVQTVVWLANRENPIPDSSGILKIVDDGNLEIFYGNGSFIWSSNTSVLSKNPTARLLDSGNFVLSDGSSSSGNVIWQSFDEPTDSFLPGMRLGLNRKTGKSWYLTSGKTPENPSCGNYYFGPVKKGFDEKSFQGVILEGSKVRWRAGPWDGRTFVGIPIMETTYSFGMEVVDDIENGDLYVTFSTAAFSTRIENYVMNSSGFVNYRYWNEESKQWIATLEHPGEKCEIHGFCGANGICDPGHSPICSCLHGFQPKSAEDWVVGKWSDGCVRRTPLECRKNGSSSDGFLTLMGIKIPDHSDWIPASSDEDCVAECKKNCSCLAYLHTSGLGCLMWVGDFMDLRKFPKGGLDLYVRLAASELETKGRRNNLVIIIVTIVSAIFIGGCAFFLWLRMANKRDSKSKEEGDVLNFDTSIIANGNTSDAKAHGNIFEKGKHLLRFDLHVLAIATNNFSNTNKLGEGGFGAVYKGVLPNGKEIAVKRLSRCSCQGLEEFKNEVIIIAKLQHRNLVRLLGCCIDREEKLLVYDYMPNKSLDAFLFDETKRRLLDWRRRFNIVEGIARGLLYLHRDSRLRIIHRDLKPSNILLDDQMNPKISDFGMARIFGGNQSQANTKKIVGTYGYMSPEYAIRGLFSEKSDVFSFGIILLEMVSGKRNTIFHHQQSSTLTGYAWMLWNDNNGLELVDPLLYNSFHTEEVLKCIHVALLCVQESANNRPTISSILSMLGSEATLILPTPKKPAFFIDAGPTETGSPMNSLKYFSKNDLTTSTISGR